MFAIYVWTFKAILIPMSLDMENGSRVVSPRKGRRLLNSRKDISSLLAGHEVGPASSLCFEPSVKLSPSSALCILQPLHNPNIRCVYMRNGL